MNEVVMADARLVATVRFLESGAGSREIRDYDYFVPDGIVGRLRPEDLAVVMVADKPKLVRVLAVAMCPTGTHKATRSVAGTVDISAWLAEKAAATRRRELIVGLEKLEERRKKLQKYEELASADPEAKAMLDELKGLGDGPVAGKPYQPDDDEGVY